MKMDRNAFTQALGKLQGTSGGLPDPERITAPQMVPVDQAYLLDAYSAQPAFIGLASRAVSKADPTDVHEKAEAFESSVVVMGLQYVTLPSPEEIITATFVVDAKHAIKFGSDLLRAGLSCLSEGEITPEERALIEGTLMPDEA